MGRGEPLFLQESALLEVQSVWSLPHSESDLGTVARPAPGVVDLADLQHALQRQEIRLQCQPIVTLKDGRTAGLLAHPTWLDPVRGALPVEGLTTAADTYGLAQALIRTQVEQACALVQALNRDPLRAGPMFVAVNLSARHLADASIAQDVVAVIRRTGINPALLALGVGELAAVADRNATTAALRSLRAAGVRVALDRFCGVGSAVLDLRELAATEVTLDENLVPSPDPGDRDLALVAGLVQLVHGLGLRCIASGVAEAAQANALRSVGCDLGWGSYWGPAVSDTEAVTRLVGS